MPVRILHGINSLSIRGGIQSVVMNLYRFIDRERVQFDFLTYETEQENSYYQEIIDLGGRVFQIDCPSVRELLPHTVQLRRIIRENGPFHAVHTHYLWQNALVAAAARSAGVRRVISHSHNVVNGQPLQQMILNRSARPIIRALSSDLAACSEEAGWFLYGNHAKFRVVPNAIDIQHFVETPQSAREALREELQIPEGALVIGHVGRFSFQKNHHFLVPLMAAVHAEEPRAVMVLVGEGELKAEIEALFQAKGLSPYLRFLGLRKDIPELLGIFDCLVLPSRFEGLCVALVEAQAAGVPCVVSAGLPRMVDMGLGLIEFVGLDAPLDEWTRAVLSPKPAPPPVEERMRALAGRGFEIRESAQEILKFYGLA